MADSSEGIVMGVPALRLYHIVTRDFLIFDGLLRVSSIGVLAKTMAANSCGASTGPM